MARRKTVVRVQRGGLIGDTAIMHDCPSPTTVTAGTARIIVWALDAAAFHAVVQAFLEVQTQRKASQRSTKQHDATQKTTVHHYCAPHAFLAVQTQHGVSHASHTATQRDKI